MALLPAVNKRETIENVREFFDREFPRIMNMADVTYVELKSPTISDMPGAPKHGNSNDDKFSNHAQAVYYLECVVRAIKAMRQPHRHFMELRYLQHKEWLEIEEITGYSTRRGMEIIEEAFLYFADRFSDTYELRVIED